MAIKQLDSIGQELFMSRYAYPGETKYAERCKAMAKHVAAVEGDEEIEKYEKKFYDALSKGTIDAISSALTSFDSRSLQEVAKYLIMLPINSPGLTWAVNLDTWNSLPPNVQTAMIEARDGVTMQSYQIVNDEFNSITTKWKAQGVEIITLSKADLDAFYANGKAIDNEWIAQATADGVPAQEAYDLWNGLIAEYMAKYNIQ